MVSLISQIVSCRWTATGSPLSADFSVYPPLLLLVATSPHWADFAAGTVVDAAGFSHHFPAVLCVLLCWRVPVQASLPQMTAPQSYQFYKHKDMLILPAVHNFFHTVDSDLKKNLNCNSERIMIGLVGPSSHTVIKPQIWAHWLNKGWPPVRERISFFFPCVIECQWVGSNHLHWSALRENFLELKERTKSGDLQHHGISNKHAVSSLVAVWLGWGTSTFWLGLGKGHGLNYWSSGETLPLPGTDFFHSLH